MTECDVTYAWYADTYRGSLPKAAFLSFLSEAREHVRWMCGERAPCGGAEEEAYRRALCAAAEAFVDYGDGQVGAFTLGDFKVSRYERDATAGADIATAAVARELAGTGLLFCGVR